MADGTGGRHHLQGVASPPLIPPPPQGAGNSDQNPVQKKKKPKRDPRAPKAAGIQLQSLPSPSLDGKQELRALMRAERRCIDPAARRRCSIQAATHALRVLRKCRRVAVYLSQGHELGTGPLIQALLKRGHRLYVPRLHDHSLIFVALDRRTQLRRNPLGILEPISRQRGGRMDAVIVPLLGFDTAGHRLGQGGGFYDRALARSRPFRQPLRIGYAYAVQQLGRVPVASHDIDLHTIVTEQGVQWATG